jgi:hypothetical protein
MPDAPKLPPARKEPRLPRAPLPDDAGEHSGIGAGSALQRLKLWERSRAAQRGRLRDKPAKD